MLRLDRCRHLVPECLPWRGGGSLPGAQPPCLDGSRRVESHSGVPLPEAARLPLVHTAADVPEADGPRRGGGRGSGHFHSRGCGSSFLIAEMRCSRVCLSHASWQFGNACGAPPPYGLDRDDRIHRAGHRLSKHDVWPDLACLADFIARRESAACICLGRPRCSLS